MSIAKIFTTGRSQAVRLPKECRFQVSEVCATRIDDMVILYPRERGWDIMEQGLQEFTDDFMAERNQPVQAEKRAELE